jgi:UDP-N-acetylmuramoyl-tripeptide--D-alanyl-D-alanine ligase
MRHFFNIMKTEQLYELFRQSTGIAIDSRTVKKGNLFFALWGKTYNGNRFAGEALEKGASWAVIDDPMFETESTVLVDDCLIELQALATHYRKQFDIPLLAITGTNGKTTTKELIAAVLSGKFRTHYTKGNNNNHIGVPLTILAAPADVQFIIVEMGANHIGEIRNLCLIAMPNYGLITNIGTAHIEGFGSYEGVVKAKTELYEYLRKVNGVALYNDMNPLLSEKIFRNVNRAVPYSDPAGIELSVETISSGLNLILSVTYHHKIYRVNTRLFGKFNLENVKAAIAAGLFFEVPVDDIIRAIEDYNPDNNRSQVRETSDNTLICDSYNANPSSMRVALESFFSLPAEKKMIILGDMLELGEKAGEEHASLLRLLDKSDADPILLVGPLFHKAAEKTAYRSFIDVGMLRDYLENEHFAGYTVFIKGSRGIGLEKIYDLI